MKGDLKNVVDDIDKWKFDSFDKIKRTKNAIMRRLWGIQRRLQLHGNIGGMRSLEDNLQKKLSNIMNRKELMWH